MLEWESVLRVIIIVVGLLALRVVVQRALQRRGGGLGPGLSSGLRFLLPPMLTGGPMFLAVACAAGALKSPDTPPFLFFMALGGGVALGIGLMLLLALFLQQQRAIEALQAQLSADETRDEG